MIKFREKRLLLCSALTCLTCQRLVRPRPVAANFFEGGPPDFLMEAMLITLTAAFDHFGLPKPVSAIGEGLGDYDAQNLQPLFLKTKLFSLDKLDDLNRLVRD